MASPRSWTRNATFWLAAMIAGLLAGVFALDLLLPAGVASGVPYVVPVLVGLRVPGRWGALLAAGVATLLTIGGHFLPTLPDALAEPAAAEDLLNRLIAVFAIWTTAVLGSLPRNRGSESESPALPLRAIVDSTPDLIVTLDADGRIESCNAAASRTFLRSADQLRGVPIEYLLEPPRPHVDGSLPPDAMELFDEDGAGCGLSSVPQQTGRRTIRWTVQPLERERRLAVGHDLTELLDAQDRAVRAERLAAIGQTLATLSHESKNELLAIRFGLEQLGGCWDDRDAAGDLISALLDSQNRLWRLFEDLRGFAAPIRLRSARTSLPRVWRRAWDSLAVQSAGRDVRLVEHVAPDSTECLADSFRLEQVFRNLFENSLAACGDPVVIDLTCTGGPWRGEEGLFVSVRDNGPGLPEEVRSRLFEPFFTTKAQGTGLGLAHSRRIAEAHHGELAAGVSAQGAEFVLTLPRRLPVMTAEPVGV